MSRTTYNNLQYLNIFLIFTFFNMLGFLTSISHLCCPVFTQIYFYFTLQSENAQNGMCKSLRVD